MSLGKGLQSLIPPADDNSAPRADSAEAKSRQPSVPARPPLPSPHASTREEHIYYVEIDKIKPNPHQPRHDFNEEELASLSDSIRQYGILQPLVVTKKEIDFPYGRRVEYELLAGERRLRAASRAGFSRVPVIIREADERTKLELAIVENVQRSDLNPIEEAEAYERLSREFSLTQEEIAARVFKSRETIANKVRLLELPKDIQQYIGDGFLTEGHAKALLSLKNPERMRLFAKETIKQSWSVRRLEEEVRKATLPKRELPEHIVDPELDAYKKQVEELLGIPVSISGSRERGRLALSFESHDELERLIDRLRRALPQQHTGLEESNPATPPAFEENL